MVEHVITAIPGDIRGEPSPNDTLAQEAVTSADRLARAVFERDRFALLAATRTERETQFKRALKSIVKELSVESAEPIPDQLSRQAARIRFYAGLSHFCTTICDQQQRYVHRARRAIQIAFASSAVAVATVALVVANYLS